MAACAVRPATTPQGDWVALSPHARRPRPHGSPGDLAPESRRAPCEYPDDCLPHVSTGGHGFLTGHFVGKAPTLASASRGEPKSALKMADRVFPRAGTRTAHCRPPQRRLGAAPGTPALARPLGHSLPLSDAPWRTRDAGLGCPALIARCPSGRRRLVLAHLSDVPSLQHGVLVM